MLTAEQRQHVLHDLPQPHEVKGDYYKVAVREYPQVTPHDGRAPTKGDGMRFFEFEKNGLHWALVSVPKL